MRLKSNSVTSKWTPTVVLLGITFLTRSAQNVALVTFPLLGAENLHLKSGTIGIAVACSGVIYALASMVLSARARDHFTVIALGVGLGFFGLGYGEFALAESVYGFFAGALFIGLGGGLSFPSLITLAGRIGPGNPEKSVTRYTVSLSLSLLVGPLVESGILAWTHNSLRDAFWIFTPWPVVALVASLLLAKKWISVLRASQADLTSPQNDKPRSASESIERISLRTQLSRPGFLRALWSQLAFDVVFSSIVSFGGLLAVTQDRIAIRTFTLLFAMFYLISLIIRLTLAAKSPITNKNILIRISCGCALVGLVFVVEHNIYLLMIGMMITGVGHGLSYPLSLSLIAEETPGHELSVANAHLTGIVKLADIILPLAIGFTAQSIGYRDAIGLMVVPALVFALAAFKPGKAAMNR